MLRICLNIALPLIFLIAGNFSSFSQLYPVKTNKKWGLINERGTLVVKAEYEAIHQGETDHTVVVKDGKYGLLNALGKVLIPTKYSYIREVNDNIVLINTGGECNEADCSGGKWGIVSLNAGNTIEPQFSFIGKFNESGFALVNIGGACDYENCEGGVWGVIDTNATIRLPAQYTEINLFSSSEAYIKSETGWGLYGFAPDHLILEPRYEVVERISPGRISVSSSGKFGILNDAGNSLIPQIYDGFRNGKFGYLAYKEIGFYGLMDSMGARITEPRFDHVEATGFNFILTKKDGFWGLVNFNNKEIFANVLREVGYTGPRFASVERGPLWGLIDTTGRTIVPIKYEMLEVIDDSIFMVKERKYLKWLDENGNIVKTVLADDIESFQNNVARIKKGDKWGLINKRGEWVAAPIFDAVMVFMHVAKCKRNEEWEYIYFDDNGQRTNVKRLIIVKGEDEGSVDITSINSLTDLGWFYNSAKQRWGLRNPNNLRVLLEPQYLSVQLVQGTNISIVQGEQEMGRSSIAYGLVDHVKGVVSVEPIFSMINTPDFQKFGLARASYASSDKYALIRPNGEVINFDGAAYIGEFADGVARINIGGRLLWNREDGMDVIQTEIRNNRNSRESETWYQHCRGGKWGYIDAQGRWVKEPEFDTALDFESGFARIGKNGKWGLVNNRFEISIEPEYDFLSMLKQDGLNTIFVVGNDRPGYGFINEEGEIIIQPRFFETGDFANGFARIREGEKWGFINPEGQVIIEPRFREVADYREGRARTRDSRNWGYIDDQGESATGYNFLRAGDFHEGLAWVQVGKFFGYIGREGNMLIKAEYTDARDFENGIAIVKSKGAMGVIDSRGRWVISPKYYNILPFSNGVAVVQEGANFGIINIKGDFVVRPQYKEIGEFNEGLASFREHLEYGFLDTLGNIAIPCQYANAGAFSEGLAPVLKVGKWGFIDTTGTEIIQCQYSSVRNFMDERAAIRIGKKWGFTDRFGNLAVPAIYDKSRDFQDGLAAVYLEGQGWGLINKDGVVIIPCEFDKIGNPYNELIPVCKNNKWGLINSYGTFITQLKYDDIGDFSENRAKIAMNRQFGLVNQNGNVIIPVEYDIVESDRGLVKVEISDKSGYIALDGNWIWKPSK